MALEVEPGANLDGQPPSCSDGVLTVPVSMSSPTGSTSAQAWVLDRP